ncbi:hypothetical protein [Azotobacter chroococcum]|uniref:Uncharacterized protein n=1 Tax=Azotobacter chroococcum NCIMB 8003 TaxID=1328314 RepID=A0A0C4WSL4_9GAMM|nr:hypothetical protein [Azotobacter chroococcum]AJE23629.1 Hypothetical protein Achr_e360 [Azotobacter chroococcum NCIMB 8003]
MMIGSILFLVLACCGLFVAGVCLGSWMRRSRDAETDTDMEGVTDDVGLFRGWDGLSAVERRQRLSLYQRRVRARIAEQEREWLRVRLRAIANG